MAVGLVGHAGIGVESSGGFASFSATIADFVPFISEDLVENAEFIDDLSIMAQWDQIRTYNGLRRVGGTIRAYANPLTAGYFFRTWFDSSTVTKGVEIGATSHAGVWGHRFVTRQGQFQCGSGSDIPTVTWQMHRGPCIDAGTSFMYYNCAGNTLDIVFNAGGIVEISESYLGRRHGRLARPTPSFPPEEVFLWHQCSIQVAGNAFADYETVTVRGNNNLESFPTLDGQNAVNQVKRNNFRQIEVNGTVSFQSEAEYERFRQGSAAQLKITAVGNKAISATPENFPRLQVDVPQFFYTAFPINIGGPGRIVANFTGRGNYDQTSGYSLQATIVNTRINPYSVNSNA